MNIRGVYKTSLIDYPGRISTVLFSGGCNLRCGYCYNRDLVLNSDRLAGFSNSDIINLLKSRLRMIDSVVLTGGEPTLSKNLFQFTSEIKGLGFSVKLDTNGLNPLAVEELLSAGLLDYVAIDIKTSAEKYSELSGLEIDFGKISSTVDILKKSGIEYELRSTVIPGYFSKIDIESISTLLGRVKRYALQQFIPGNSHIDEKFAKIQPFRVEEIFELRDMVMAFADECVLRGI